MEEKVEYSIQEAILYSHKMAQMSKALWKAIEKDWQDWVKPYGLNINEHHILLIAYHLKGSSISEISKFGVMHVSTAFNFSKNLEDRGLLTFSKKENDKRNTYVELTDKGVNLLLEIMETHDVESRQIVKGSLSLKKLYGKFPEFLEMVAVIRDIYGDEYMDIFNRTIQNVKQEMVEEEK
ncbi:MarR family protease production transcriptional regulator HPr [Salirhabdus euzebyi]|uniref:MarR family protease production transcriptional regulator HPr n=2 Tax=Salirhabdus euzebyi TaxID=394506 RepID=A0A841Q8D5_9BACI|nr:HTH-type transcriptional regulator Hpr [Salirhabdus euzebyi]MBB6454670.1 MarR family protease production transcriptional regulator HPr [Salirhabdus euzebyi]